MLVVATWTYKLPPFGLQWTINFIKPNEVKGYALDLINIKTYELIHVFAITTKNIVFNIINN